MTHRGTNPGLFTVKGGTIMSWLYFQPERSQVVIIQRTFAIAVLDEVGRLVPRLVLSL